MFRRPSLPSIAPRDLPANAYVLDVREPDEWDAGHAPDAHHIPMSELLGRLGEVPEDGSVVVVCRSGHRSAQVVSYLLGQGRGNAVNLDGGMVEWVASGLPIVTDDGRDPYIA